ncbi:MAG: hypothetical protein KGO53_10740 [Alphaproteobacteria bacterium]|nr:hypothetical protein [Alphaproteobacteria bacterium]
MQNRNSIHVGPWPDSRPIPLAPRRAAKPPMAAAALEGRRAFFRIKRQPLRDLSLARLLKGGRLSDSGRLGRYALLVATGVAFTWLPAIAYIKFAKPQFKSHFSLILPGAGIASSINLADIGQASSAANSAYASTSISPTVTYKNLIMSANVVEQAAAKLGLPPEAMPVPTIKLVDETSFITVEMPGYSGEEARDRAAAIQDAFFTELNKLRDDEIKRREGSTIDTVREYEQKVNAVRAEISALQAKSGLNSVEQFSTMVSGADTLKAHIAETEAALAKSQQSSGALAATLSLTPAQAALAMKLHADPQFQALADATSKAQADYAEAGQQYGANHPKVVEARTRFEGAQGQMMARAARLTGLSAKQLTGKLDFSPAGQRSPLMSQLVTLETDREGLQGQLAAEHADLDKRSAQIAGLAATAAQLDKLNRDFKVAEAVFASALARINTSKTDIFASYPMVQVTEAPVKPLLPSSPNKKLALIAAAAASLMIFFAAGLGWIRRPLIDKLLKKQHEGA